MIYPIYHTGKKKIKLKRSKHKLLIFPVLLIIPVFILGLVSISKHFFNQEIQANIINNEHPELSSKSTVQLIPPPHIGMTNSEEVNKTSDTVICQSSKQNKQPKNSTHNKIKEFKIKSGDTITDILSDYFDSSEIYFLSKKCRNIFPLHKIKAGHSYRLIFEDSLLSGFEYDINKDKKLHVQMNNGKFAVSKKDIKYDVENTIIQGVINTNLFDTVEKQGESAVLAISLANIFAWDVDFIRDLRQGDSFKLIVEKRFRKGVFSGYGKILAAQFTNQGKTFRAFLYENKGRKADYFNAEGQAIRKTFLKAPLNFTRISSGYSLHRKHPVLNVVRPHRGIDYAAPRGTPIESVADGEVLSKGYDRQAGNYVKIRHPNSYVTVYNHMSSFARGLRKGDQVVQGQTIGYVGSTGLSTGPHLDYRVKKYGRYINPLNVESKPVEPLPDSEMARFKDRIRPLLAVLSGDKSLYALSEKIKSKKFQ